MESIKLLPKQTDISIAIIGDICIDLYYFITHDYTEYSVETGLKTQAVERFSYELGGAGNVAINCKRLGAQKVDVYGILGKDPYGGMAKQIFQTEGIGTQGLFEQGEGWSTHVYHKVFQDGKELPRFDIGIFNHPDNVIIDSLLDLFVTNLSQYQVVIINEQVLQGIHSSKFQKRLKTIIDQNADLLIWLADCRKINDQYHKTIRKLNQIEAMELYLSVVPNDFNSLNTSEKYPSEIVDPAEIENRNGQPHQKELREKNSDPEFPVSNKELIEWLFNRWNYPVVLTLGEKGVISYDGHKISTIPGLHIIKQIDTVGAGDAFIAGLAVSYSSGYTLSQSTAIGNFSAGICIQQLNQTGHPSIEAVNALIEDPNYRYNPEIANDVHHGQYLQKSDIEIIDPKRQQIFDKSYPLVAIFDHDGTISTLRHGWESVMREMMVESIAGEEFNSLPLVKLEKITTQVDELIEKTTGVQTLIQMHELVKLVELNDIIPKEKILDPVLYKKIYNKRLLARIGVKVDRLESGILSVQDVTMKGAVGFLQELHKNGVKLFLASGTDQEDVQNEAELLGYASLFAGGIFGSLGNIEKDPKQEVVQRILKSLDSGGTIKPENCIMFGDGPVEIREAKKQGIPAIGLVSDELQRYGINYQKRNRLIIAGADVLIPDFSWITPLGKWLGWKR